MTASSADASSLFAGLLLLSRAMDTRGGMAPARATTAALRVSPMQSMSRLASVYVTVFGAVPAHACESTRHGQTSLLLLLSQFSGRSREHSMKQLHEGE
jgi:hypothetical protein